MRQALDTATGIAIPTSISLMAARTTTGGLHIGLGTTTIITRTAHRITGRIQATEGMEITVHRMEAIARVAVMGTAIAE